MLVVIFIGLILVVAADARLLQAQDRLRYQQTFQISSRLLWITAVLILVVFWAMRGHLQYAPHIFLGSMLPVYLWKRRCLLASLERPLQGQDDLVLDAYRIVLCWFLLALLSTMALRGALHTFDSAHVQLFEVVASSFMSLLIMIGLIYQVSPKLSPHGFTHSMALTRVQSAWKEIVLPGLIGLTFAGVAAYLISSRKIHPQTPLSGIFEENQSVNSVIAFLIVAIVCAPFCEEVIFRGYFYKVIQRVKGERYALVAIALLFALLHVGQYWGDWLAIVMVALLGFALTGVRAWTGSTVSSVVTHYVYNGGVTFLTVIFLMSANPAYFQYQIYRDRLKDDENITLLQESIVRQPDLSDAYNDLAFYYAKNNMRLEEALQMIDYALSRDPDRLDYLDTKADVLDRLGDTAQSLKLRKYILELEVSNEKKSRQLRRLGEIRKISTDEARNALF